MQVLEWVSNRSSWQMLLHCLALRCHQVVEVISKLLQVRSLLKKVSDVKSVVNYTAGRTHCILMLDWSVARNHSFNVLIVHIVLSLRETYRNI